MRRSILLTMTAVIVLAVAWGTSLGAQQPKPDFTGRWVIVSPAKSAGQEQVVTADDKTLTFGRPDGSRKQSYQLDGVERRMPLPSGGARTTDITIMATAKWDGNRIMITTITSYGGGMRTEGKDVWSIDAQGRLVIDYTETGAPPSRAIFARKGKTHS